jgi:hypothetical protein
MFKLCHRTPHLTGDQAASTGSTVDSSPRPRLPSRLALRQG